VGPQPVGCSLHNIRYSMELVHAPGRVIRSDAMSGSRVIRSDAMSGSRRITHHTTDDEPNRAAEGGGGARPACSGPGARIGRITL
jgi:hypothetical protein